MEPALAHPKAKETDICYRHFHTGFGTGPGNARTDTAAAY
jgi:hypothetical protein